MNIVKNLGKGRLRSGRFFLNISLGLCQYSIQENQPHTFIGSRKKPTVSFPALFSIFSLAPDLLFDYVLIRTVLQSRARGSTILILCVKLGYSWIADRKMRTNAVMKGQKIKSIILNLPSCSHELAKHEDLCVPDTPPNEEKDSEGYFRCSARCGLVFKAKASMNRYIVSLVSQ